jgi:hypothetical protein
MGDHVACVEALRNAYKMLVGNRKDKEKFGDRSIGGGIILKVILVQ